MNKNAKNKVTTQPHTSTSELQSKTVKDLQELAKSLDADEISGLRKQDLIKVIFEKQVEKKGNILAHLKGSDRKTFVAKMFGRIADRYDMMNTIMTCGMHHYWRKRTALVACNELKGQNILDVASGTGDLAIELVRKSPSVKVVALDLTPQMLKLAFDKAANKGLSNKIQPPCKSCSIERSSGGQPYFASVEASLSIIIQLPDRYLEFVLL
mgnify:CR=1 FL=1